MADPGEDLPEELPLSQVSLPSELPLSQVEQLPASPDELPLSQPGNFGAFDLGEVAPPGSPGQAVLGVENDPHSPRSEPSDAEPVQQASQRQRSLRQACSRGGVRR